MKVKSKGGVSIYKHQQMSGKEIEEWGKGKCEEV
jgi:hypothetical protein